MHDGAPAGRAVAAMPFAPDALAGRVALVTGGTGTLGQAIVDALLAVGARVVRVALGPTAPLDPAAAAHDAAAAPARLVDVVGDVTDDAVLARAVDAATARFGQLDVVVTAAVSYLDAGLATSRADWWRALDVNLVSAARAVALAAPRLAQSPHGGAVVHLASIGGKVGIAGRATYPAAKAALLQLARNQAAELAAQRVRVNTVSPGWTWSDPLARLACGDRDRADRVAARLHPLGRAADPHDVAQCVVFLCCDAARFVTGTDLAVDGGYAALGPEQGLPASRWFDQP
jgi:NAD(P)-dependent dehydrogenase (short-subunit alcohol dehydrogenase family)